MYALFGLLGTSCDNSILFLSQVSTFTVLQLSLTSDGFYLDTGQLINVGLPFGVTTFTVTPRTSLSLLQIKCSTFPNRQVPLKQLSSTTVTISPSFISTVPDASVLSL